MNPRIFVFSLAALTVSSIAFAQFPSPFSQTAAEAYVSATGNEMILELDVAGQGMPSGISISQRYLINQSAQFCRKYTVLSPNAQATYACFSQNMDEGTAAEFYSRIETPETNVLFRDPNSGFAFLGVSWAEKSQRNDLCVATSPIAPDAPVTYNCYFRTNEIHGPIGGGVTVGN